MQSDNHWEHFSLGSVSVSNALEVYTIMRYLNPHFRPRPSRSCWGTGRQSFPTDSDYWSLCKHHSSWLSSPAMSVARSYLEVFFFSCLHLARTFYIIHAGRRYAFGWKATMLLMQVGYRRVMAGNYDGVYRSSFGLVWQGIWRCGPALRFRCRLSVLHFFLHALLISREFASRVSSSDCDLLCNSDFKAKLMDVARNSNRRPWIQSGKIEWYIGRLVYSHKSYMLSKLPELTPTTANGVQTSNIYFKNTV